MAPRRRDRLQLALLSGGYDFQPARFRSPSDRAEQRPVAIVRARRKTFLHPELGTIKLDCDALAAAGTDLDMIVYTAPAGSPDADALALLETIGLQSFSD